VRLRLKQHCCIVVSNVNVAHNVERHRSSRRSVGLYRDWQSWGQSPAAVPTTSVSPTTASVGARRHWCQRARCFISVHCFIHSDKHYPLKQYFL
jgi:hypothetical protein